MNLNGYACLAGMELVNDLRTIAYGLGNDSGGYEDLYDDVYALDPSSPAAGFEFHPQDCDALDFAYTTPADDPAPWYDGDFPASSEFLGLVSTRMTVSDDDATRSFTERMGPGGTPGTERLASRVVEVTAWMIATSQRGMWWGERWLKQVLRGQRCAPGCDGGTLTVLPFCDDDGFRTLMGAALVSGPSFTPLTDNECVLQQVHFQLQSSMPWMYGDPVTEVEASVDIGETGCVAVGSTAWFDGAAMTITLMADAEAVDELTVTITESLDGTCPETRVMTSAMYRIPALAKHSSLVIDASRRHVTYHNPTSKQSVPGFPMIANAPTQFCWPEIGPCNRVCVCLENGGASPVSWRVESRRREV